MDKESAYLRQKIDCNCNDCKFMLRDSEKLKQHLETYKGTGLSDNLQFGDCIKFNAPVNFIPNVCQVETQNCFLHRKDNLFPA